MERGGEAPVWARDEDVTECPRCHRGFGFLLRRHHCRYCGQIFCDRCSSRGWPLPHEIKRVCDGCFQLLASGRATASDAVTVRAASLGVHHAQSVPAVGARAHQPPAAGDADFLDDLEGAVEAGARTHTGGHGHKGG